MANLEAASLPYKLLGLPQVGADEVVKGQNVRVRALRAGESLIELLEPTSPESPIATFLEKRSPSLHHVALRSEALEADIARLEAEGARFIDPIPRPGRAGTQVVFLHPKWTGGVLVELVEHG